MGPRCAHSSTGIVCPRVDAQILPIGRNREANGPSGVLVPGSQAVPLCYLHRHSTIRMALGGLTRRSLTGSTAPADLSSRIVPAYTIGVPSPAELG